MAAETTCIPDPQEAWVRSTMTEDKIQALVDRVLLWPKTEVEWRAAAGEEFPSEDVKEQVVFASFFERGFNLLAGDFFRGLLYYYRLELVHLVPNSITIVSTFIHFCEAYLGIPPHFTLWRYFFCVKSTGKRSGPVGGCNVQFEVRPQGRMDRRRPPRQHRRVEVGVVLHCGPDSGSSAVNWP
jgi:hypothetical protein